MKHYLFYCILFLGTSFSVSAQTINLEFPYFAGKTYDFTIFQGDKRITVKRDTVPEGGKVQLIIPEQYKGYKGIAQWYLTNSATGGGLDLIINNEDFSVSCFDSVPTAESIVYKNTTENLIDKATYKKQQQFFEKHDAMLATKRAYEKDSELYKLASTEYSSLLKQYEEHSKALSTSLLYAAKFRQIVNLTMGIGTLITVDEKAKAHNINDFIVTELDFAALYTSNHWGGVINNWVQLHTSVFKDDTKLLQDVTTILHRLPSDKIYTDFVVNLTKEISKIGKDYILDALTATIKNSRRLLHNDGVLKIYQLDLSGQAPDLSIVVNSGKKEATNPVVTVLKTTELHSKFTLLVFYRSGCGPCEETMEGLVLHYKEMVAKGFRIITIASDTDEKIFKDTSMPHPWADKYCDFKGAEGINFKNYGVIGTPTMYVLDSKGIIVSKMATLTNVLDFVKKL
ncbi:peroxiredoxin family protein [Flavobacterium sp. GB2R13]|uniref:peroxiredoxin family protein n=1 Tax=Flavobacterium algoris TaxID=3398733 RepID=UPI003A8615AE